MKKNLNFYFFAFICLCCLTSFSLATPMEKCVNKGSRIINPVMTMVGIPAHIACQISCPTGGNFEFIPLKGGCNQSFFYCPNLNVNDEVPVIGQHWEGRRECPSRKEVQDYKMALERADSEKLMKELDAKCREKKKKAEALLKEQKIARDAYIKEYGNSFVDERDGLRYRTVKIGNQEWMAENLKYEQKKKCPPNRDCNETGGLYNWNEAIDACPDGWHLPTQRDFLLLLKNTGLEPSGYVDALRTIEGWGPFDKCGDDVIYGRNGTDAFGFSVVPTYWVKSGTSSKGISQFWTSIKGKTLNGSLGASAVIFKQRPSEKALEFSEVLDNLDAKKSVRCIKDKINAYISANGGVFIDNRDGTSYKTIKIGVLNWMAENLIFQTKKSECVKDDECSKFGRKYTRDDALNVCPSGWHLPTKEEYNALKNNTGNKAERLQDALAWADGLGSDDYGFAALPTFGDVALFWTATVDSEHGDGKCNYYFRLEKDRVNVQQCDMYFPIENRKLPVRCVENMQMDNLETFTDERDNHEYKMITIGAQVWMAENLNYDTGTSDAICYKNKHYNCKKYGRLYSWNAVGRVCPSGFRVPNNEDFQNISNKTQFNASVQGLWEQRFWSSDGYVYSNFKLYKARDDNYPIRCIKE